MSYFLLENYIKLVLKEKVNAKIKLNIFDFDHTLYNPEKKFFLFVYVDDLKMAGLKQNIAPMWKELGKTISLDRGRPRNDKVMTRHPTPLS